MNESKHGKALATHLHDTMFQAHRGAFVRGADLIIFGNDGYKGDSKGRARREVEAAVTWAEQNGLTVTDFGTNEEGYSWALVCRGGQPDALADLAVAAEDVLWRAWMGDAPGPESQAFEAIQRKQSMTAGE